MTSQTVCCYSLDNFRQKCEVLIGLDELRRHLTVVCLPSVTFMHPTQTTEIFGNVYTPCGTLAIPDLSIKIYGDCPRGTPLSGELNTRGVAEYNDFGPIERYISETVQDMS